MKYKRIFEDSWNELCEMAKKGRFTPHQEQDIVCIMYHLCLERLGEPKQIHASSTWNFDLILGKMKAEKHKDQRIAHCLLAEVKFILKKGRKNKRIEGAKKDIDKLSLQGDPSVGKVLAIFDKPRCIEQTEIDLLKHHNEDVSVLYGCP